jgi:colanic acid biosynthesis glycosyl transferase WcaI
MRILIVTQWYPPEPQKLLADLAQTLRALGHDVEVLTGFPNYPSGRLYPGYRVKFWQREVLDGVPLIRVPLYPDHSRSGVKRAINYLSFALAAAVIGPWLVRRPEAIFVLHPPLTIALPAWVISQVYRTRFVFNVQDLWPETLAATGMLNDKRVLALIGRVANWVYAASASVIVISPGFRRSLLARGVPSDKVHVISNWVDTEHYRPVEADPALARTHGLDGRFNIVFAGVVGRAQGLEVLLRSAALLRDLPNVQFVVLGDGVDLPELVAAAARMNVTNVKFLGRHPEGAMPSFFSLADVLLVHLKDDPLFRITIPHKILSYMASGKPVLAAVAGDAADVIRGASAGLVCPPEDPEALAATVRQFHAMTSAERETMGARARQAACESYGREHLVGEVAQVLAQSARNGKHVATHA